MDDELYTLARNRIDKRNRQIYLLGANVLGMFVYLGAFAALGDAIPKGVGVFIAIVWIGLVGFHAMMLSAMQNRKGEIDREVERLRQAIYDEKPKRLALDEDGELGYDDNLIEWNETDELRQDLL